MPAGVSVIGRTMKVVPRPVTLSLTATGRWIVPEADLYFAWHAGDDGRERGWYLLYPGDDGEDDLYVGPHSTFDEAHRASLAERV